MNEWIKQYAAGYSRLSEAVNGLSDEQLNFKPAPYAWSIKEIAVHVADTEIVAIYRMKSVIAEDNPALLSFDQDKWTDRLQYSKADLDQAMLQFKVLREGFTKELLSVEEQDWKRIGTHNQAGMLTLGDLIQSYIKHVEDHINQIERNNAAYNARS